VRQGELEPVNGQRGFTLIEILVALLVFVTGVAGLLALLVTALALHRDGLDLGRATRDLDELRAVLRAEVAAGEHFDAEQRTWKDIPSAQLPDGTRYAVHFLAGDGVQPARAAVRVGRSEAELAAAPVALILVLPDGPTLAEEVRRYRRRHGTPAPDAPLPDAPAQDAPAPNEPVPGAPVPDAPEAGTPPAAEAAAPEPPAEAAPSGTPPEAPAGTPAGNDAEEH
jgi:prepilin-type N-terminal cleavage/methylation domain-containing protein